MEKKEEESTIESVGSNKKMKKKQKRQQKRKMMAMLRTQENGEENQQESSSEEEKNDNINKNVSETEENKENPEIIISSTVQKDTQIQPVQKKPRIMLPAAPKKQHEGLRCKKCFCLLAKDDGFDYKNGRLFIKPTVLKEISKKKWQGIVIQGRRVTNLLLFILIVSRFIVKTCILLDQKSQQL
jgi:hypothetical protein